VEEVEGESVTLFKEKEKNPRYHATVSGAPEWALASVSDEQLEKWKNDPNCIEQHECAAYLVKRLNRRAERQEEQRAARAAKREELQDNPFDPRTELSADAKHIASRIVTHLWILFVALPVVLGLLYGIITHM